MIVAERNGCVKNQKLTKKNNRDVFTDSNGKQTKKPDKGKGHDILC